MKPTTSLLALSLLLALLSAPSLTSAAVKSCSDVYSPVMGCLSYVLGADMNQGCCNGVKALMAAIRSRSDRQTTCRCIKSAASNYDASGTYTRRAMGIPSACGISISFKLDPNVDCNKIK